MTRILRTPLGDASGRPWSACGFQLFFESQEINFDQLTQLAQDGFEILRGRVVLVVLRLRRTCSRHALRVDHVTDTIVNRRRRVHVALASCGVTTQSALELINSSIQRRRFVLKTLWQ